MWVRFCGLLTTGFPNVHVSVQEPLPPITVASAGWPRAWEGLIFMFNGHEKSETYAIFHLLVTILERTKLGTRGSSRKYVLYCLRVAENPDRASSERLDILPRGF